MPINTPDHTPLTSFFFARWTFTSAEAAQQTSYYRQLSWVGVMAGVSRQLCVFLLLLWPQQLNCSTGWELASSGPWRRRLLTISQTSRDSLHYGLLWRSWTHAHNKTYSTSNEGLERYVVWRSNTAFIQYHNSYADKFGFTMAMNGFGDQVREFCNMHKAKF